MATWEQCEKTLIKNGYYPTVLKLVTGSINSNSDKIIGMRIPFSSLMVDDNVKEISELLPDKKVYHSPNTLSIEIE